MKIVLGLFIIITVLTIAVHGQGTKDVCVQACNVLPEDDRPACLTACDAQFPTSAPTPAPTPTTKNPDSGAKMSRPTAVAVMLTSIIVSKLLM